MYWWEIVNFPEISRKIRTISGNSRQKFPGRNFPTHIPMLLEN